MGAHFGPEYARGPRYSTKKGKTPILLVDDAKALIKRRCRQAGMENASLLCNHTFRGRGITAYLRNEDSKLEHAQQIAGHSDPKTTLLYDRRSDEISLDEVEKIGI